MEAAAGLEFVVGAGFDDAARREDQDSVGVDDPEEAAGDDERRQARHEALYRAPDQVLRLRVQRGRRLMRMYPKNRMKLSCFFDMVSYSLTSPTSRQATGNVYSA